MLPAQDGFKAEQLLGVDVDLGAVVDLKLPHGDGFSELDLHLALLFGAQLHGGLKEDKAVSASGFGLVEGEVGALQQLPSFRGVGGGCCDADADADVHGTSVDEVGALDELDDACGEVADVAGVVEDDAELVAAKAGEGVGIAELAGDAFCDAAEECVAYGVAEAIVYGFEAVEVQQDEDGCGGCGAGGMTGLRQGLLEAVVEEAAVADSGEFICEGVLKFQDRGWRLCCDHGDGFPG